MFWVKTRSPGQRPRPPSQHRPCVDFLVLYTSSPDISSLKSRDKCLKQTAWNEKKKTCFDVFFIFTRPFLLFLLDHENPECSSLVQLSATLFLCHSPFPFDLYSASSDGRVVLYPKDIIAFWEGQMTKDQINHNTKLISERTVVRWWAMTPCTSATMRCGSVNTAT